MFNNLKLQWRMIILISVASLVVMAVISVFFFNATAGIVRNRVKAQMFAEAHAISHEVDAFFNRIGQIPVTVAHMDVALLDQEDHTEQLLDQAYQVLANDPDILNVYTAYEKGVVDGLDYVISAWMYDAERRNISRMTGFNFPTDEDYDPSQPTYEYHTDDAWYALAKREGRFVWGPPYYDEGGTNQYIVSAVGPIFREEQFVGVAGVDVTLDHLNEIITNVKFGETGYAFVVGPDTRYIAYPFAQEAMMAGETLFDLAEKTDNEQVRAIAEAIVAGETGYRETVNPSTGDTEWTIFVPIESTGWWLVLTVPIKEFMTEVNDIARLAVIISVGGLIIIAVVGFWIARSVTKPLQVIVRRAKSLAMGEIEADEASKRISARGDELGDIGQAFDGLVDYFREMGATAHRIADGDLSAQVTPRSTKDEFGNAFSQMIFNLRSIVGQVADTANNVGAAAGQLAAAAEQAGQATSQIAATIQQVAAGTAQQTEGLTKAVGTVEQVSRAIGGVARGAQEQAAAVAQSSGITSQITAAIQQVTVNAQAGAQGAAQASQTARDGGQTVDETIQGMAAIKDKVGLSARKVQEMGRRSMQIGAIVETIDDIASQTNLLALNAAIEAARAGEHGKGFAVVADEVRKLAEKSAVATREIAELIQGIQGIVGEAVVAMDEGAAEVEAGVSRADEAGQALAGILQAVEAVAQQVEEISAAAQQMSASADEMASAMETVSAVVEENTAATEEMAAGSDEVTQAIECIASVSQENSAAVEEVNAAAEEMSAQVEEVADSARALSEMAADLQAIVNNSKLSTNESLADKIELFKQAHLRWVDRLNEMLAGRLALQESEVASHVDCILGKWYYGRGQTDLGDLPEFRAIEEPHTHMHEVVRSTVAGYNRGDRKAAEASLSEVKRLSRQIVEDLDRLERRASGGTVSPAVAQSRVKVPVSSGDVQRYEGLPLTAGNGRW
jgi:methyl-accepting chemotaxis protein